MPNPVLPNSLFQDSSDQNQQPTGHLSATHRAGPPDTPGGTTDSSGRPLALRLPDWDLLPPTEFLQRHQDR
jgi:hypothetical protein